MALITGTHKRRNRLYGLHDTLRFEPVVTQPAATAAKKDKPARISQRQFAPIASLLRRVAKGGDAAVMIDAQTLLPLVDLIMATAPPGQPRARASYAITLADGSAVTAAGLHNVAKLVGRAHSTLANAISKGKGVTTFPAHDEHGNPAVITVRKLA